MSCFQVQTPDHRHHQFNIELDYSEFDFGEASCFSLWTHDPLIELSSIIGGLSLTIGRHRETNEFLIRESFLEMMNLDRKIDVWHQYEERRRWVGSRSWSMRDSFLPYRSLPNRSLEERICISFLLKIVCVKNLRQFQSEIHRRAWLDVQRVERVPANENQREESSTFFKGFFTAGDEVLTAGLGAGFEVWDEV